jgi:hypothetical protein
MDVRVYVIEGKSIRTTNDILNHIRRVVGFVARENRIHGKTGPLGCQRCLLYEDLNGQLFNLTLVKHAVGPAGKWEEYLGIAFLEKRRSAMIALTVLCRSFPCATEGMYFGRDVSLFISNSRLQDEVKYLTDQFEPRMLVCHTGMLDATETKKSKLKRGYENVHSKSQSHMGGKMD